MPAKKQTVAPDEPGIASHEPDELAEESLENVASQANVVAEEHARINEGMDDPAKAETMQVARRIVDPALQQTVGYEFVDVPASEALDLKERVLVPHDGVASKPAASTKKARRT